MHNIKTSALESILDTIKDYVASLDKDGFLIYCNASMTDLITKKLGVSLITEKPFLESFLEYPNFGFALGPAISQSEKGHNSRFTIELQNSLLQFEVKPLMASGELEHVIIGRSLDSARNRLSEIISANKKKKKHLNKLESIFSTPLLGICICNLQGDISECNDTLAQLLAYPKATLLGKSWRDIIHPEDLHLSKKEFRKIITDETDFLLLHSRFLGRTGLPIPAEISIRKVAEEEENYLVILVRDLSQLKNIEYTNQKLYNDINQFKQALEKSSLLFRTNTEGIITHVNENFCKLTGYSYEELIGNSPKIFKSNYHTGDFYKDLWSTLKRGNTWQGEFKNIAKNGEYFWIFVSITPIFNSRNQISEFLSICFDITPEKLNETQLLESNEKLDKLTTHLKQKNAQLQDFADIATHNLRSPINNLKSLLDLFIQLDTQENHEIVTHFEIAVQSLEATVTNLTKVIEMSFRDLESFERINLPKLLQQTKENLAHKVKEFKAEIYCDFSNCEEIFYPFAYLESIFHNMLSNALKYHSPERVPKISIRSILKNDCIELVFKDNGLGIDLERFGKDLFKMNKTFHTNTDSRGVGLYITKNQIESMGGKIFVASTPGIGTEFTIHLKRVNQ